MPEIFTTVTLAERWLVSQDTIEDQLRAGRLRGFKVGKQWRIPASAVAEVEEGRSRSLRAAS